MVFLSPPDEPLLYLFEEVWVNRCYAPASFSTASGQTIVDIGAHIGVFTVWAATSYPTARVIAVEPTSDLCAYLRRNVEYNQLGNVDVVEAAVGGFRGEAILWQRGSGMMNSLYTGDNYGSPFRQLQRTPVLLLEDIFERFQVQSCALLKLDCEGSEYEIFFAAPERVLAKVQRISVEYHMGLSPHTPEELEDLLCTQGFAVRRLPPDDEEVGYLYASRRR